MYEIHLILEKAMDNMKNSPILLEVRCPVNICGDIHGQYGDLMRIFNVSFMPVFCRIFQKKEVVIDFRHAGCLSNRDISFSVTMWIGGGIL